MLSEESMAKSTLTGRKKDSGGEVQNSPLTATRSVMVRSKNSTPVSVQPDCTSIKLINAATAAKRQDAKSITSFIPNKA